MRKHLQSTPPPYTAEAKNRELIEIYTKASPLLVYTIYPNPSLYPKRSPEVSPSPNMVIPHVECYTLDVRGSFLTSIYSHSRSRNTYKHLLYFLTPLHSVKRGVRERRNKGKIKADRYASIEQGNSEKVN